MRLPEVWTRISRGAPAADPSTGNEVPAAPIETTWRGLLQLPLLRIATNDILPDVADTRMLLLLEPGVVTSSRDVWRFDGPAGSSDVVAVGDTVQVNGAPRTRRTVRNGQRASYIVAKVQHATDLQE